MKENSYIKFTENKLQSLVKLRKYFHANPELSGEEEETAKTIKDLLSELQPTQIIDEVGGTGVIAIFDSGKPGKSVMLRAELDALPIQETNEFPYKSSVENVSHKCGHDGHMTTLFGVATYYAEHPPEYGKVILLFQPSEENGRGAKAVVQDPKFELVQPDYVFAFHNLPGYPLNQIVIRRGAFSAQVKSIILKLYGKTSHAAEPEFGANPAMAIAEIILETNKLSNNDPDREDFALITPVFIEMGKKNYGTSAGYGEVHLTMRTWTNESFNVLKHKLFSFINDLKIKYKLRIRKEWTNEFYANQNGDASVNIIEKAANENGFSCTERDFPFKWGEDFGLFTQRYKGAMFGIGSGENHPALHNPDFDFPDDIIPVGMKMFIRINSILMALSKE